MPRFAVVFGLAVCSLVGCETPEKSPVAEVGYRAAAPVIAATDKFREDHGRYPVKLQELSPHYLRQVRQVAVFDSQNGDLQGYEYYPKGDRYGLNFVYYTSVYANLCCYDSQTKKWETIVIH
jgi:hypothetical protein